MCLMIVVMWRLSRWSMAPCWHSMDINPNGLIYIYLCSFLMYFSTAKSLIYLPVLKIVLLMIEVINFPLGSRSESVLASIGASWWCPVMIMVFYRTLVDCVTYWITVSWDLYLLLLLVLFQLCYCVSYCFSGNLVIPVIRTHSHHDEIAVESNVAASLTWFDTLSCFLIWTQGSCPTYVDGKDLSDFHSW
jgi:hypothetical protein